MENIDLELLISLIEERPVLWDKTAEDYKNKRLTYEGWREVCLHIQKDFELLSDGEKNDLGKLIMKKWANLKDHWIKCHKKMEFKSGSKAKPVHKYKFYDQMKFLSKIVDTGESSTELLEDKNTETNKERIKKAANQVEEKMKKTIDAVEREYNSRIMHFFKGISPIVDQFSDDDIVEFQFEVLNIIRQIKASQQTEKRQIKYEPAPGTSSEGY